MNGLLPESKGGLIAMAGYDYIYFSGTPIVKDDKSNSGEVVLDNTQFDKWYGLKQMVDATPVDISSMYMEGNDYDDAPKSLGFGWTGFSKPVDQYVAIGQLLIIGNRINSAPRLTTRATTVSS
jgi:hypothetical protein